MKAVKCLILSMLTAMSMVSIYAQKIFEFPKSSHSSPILPNLQADDFLLPKDMRLKIISPHQPSNLPFILLLSGDGGWTKFDQFLAESLANEGLSIIGMDTKIYFWSAKTPDYTTMDVNKVIKYYQAYWKNENFVLVGYSFGADIIPFIANRLNPSLKKALRGVLALSPDEYSDFEIHLATLLNLKKSTKYNVVSEFKNLQTIAPVIYFGSQEDMKLKSLYIEQGLNTIILTGNHHFNFDYPRISKSLIREMSLK